MTTTAYSLGSILGAQLRSVLEAETENAQSIADFITSVGFEKKQGQQGLGELRMIEFDMLRRNEEGEHITHTIKVPLLSIIPIPMLSIEQADFDFDLKIHDVIKKEGEERENIVKKPFSKNLIASFARTKRKKKAEKETSSERTLDSNMSIKVSVVQTDFPLGVEKILNLSELGIQDTLKDNDGG